MINVSDIKVAPNSLRWKIITLAKSATQLRPFKAKICSPSLGSLRGGGGGMKEKGDYSRMHSWALEAEALAQGTSL